MEAIMILIIGICYALLLVKKDKSLAFVLGILSVDIIATFAVLAFSNRSEVALVIFVVNLLVTPWIAFRLAAKGMPQKSKK